MIAAELTPSSLRVGGSHFTICVVVGVEFRTFWGIEKDRDSLTSRCVNAVWHDHTFFDIGVGRSSLGNRLFAIWRCPFRCVNDVGGWDRLWAGVLPDLVAYA